MKTKPNFVKIWWMMVPGIVFFCQLFPAVSLADYAQMNKALNDYRPPDFFYRLMETEKKPLLLTDPAKDSNPANLQIKDQVSSKIQDRIQALKNSHDNELDINTIPFLSDLDTRLYTKLKDKTTNLPAIGGFIGGLIGNEVMLEEIEILAALVNPGVLAAQKQVAAERLSYDQIMGLDDTLKRYEQFTKSLNNMAGPVPMKTSIKQGWPFPGLTGLKGKIIKEQVAIAIEKMNLVQREVITQARKTYWELVYVDESKKITAETIDALERLRSVATVLYKSGKTSFQDIIKINIKVALLKEDLITLSSKRKSIEASMVELLNLPAGTRVGRAANALPFKKIGLPESLYPIARQNRQELKVIRHRINKLGNMIQMAEAMIQEPFTLGLSSYENDMVSTVGTDAPREAFSEKTMAAMKNNQPQKPWYGLSAPWLNQTRQTLSSLKQTRIKEEKTTDRMVQEAWFMADKNRRELVLYEKKILPLSKSALDVSDREYESGSIPFSQAIDSYTFWLTVKLTIASKKSGLGASIASLERMMGKTL